MTLEEHLKQIIGDLVLTVARQSAELDALRPTPQSVPTDKTVKDIRADDVKHKAADGR
jgi:hypothetical protein